MSTVCSACPNRSAVAGYGATARHDGDTWDNAARLGAEAEGATP